MAILNVEVIPVLTKTRQNIVLQIKRGGHCLIALALVILKLRYHQCLHG
jgi:hypothetical protein